jgi:hypothetical protein
MSCWFYLRVFNSERLHSCVDMFFDATCASNTECYYLFLESLLHKIKETVDLQSPQASEVGKVQLTIVEI